MRKSTLKKENKKLNDILDRYHKYVPKLINELKANEELVATLEQQVKERDEIIIDLSHKEKTSTGKAMDSLIIGYCLDKQQSDMVVTRADSSGKDLNIVNTFMNNEADSLYRILIGKEGLLS